jgi:site-specific DNA-methyltransferase (adenine-specific)
MEKYFFYNCDCIEGARKYLRDNTIDLIITDPPYGIGGDKLEKHYNRDESNVIEGYVEVPASQYADFSQKWIKEAERVLKPGGSMYIVSGWTHLRHILNALSGTRLKEINHIIWKYNFGVYTRTKYISSHYHILYYAKPGAKKIFNTNAFFADTEKTEDGGSLNYLDREDVWVINKEYKPGKIKNKNELPSALLKKMILYSSKENDFVADFFLGSFSTAKIALELGRKAIGFEINKTAFDIQMNNIAKIQYGSALDTLREIPKNTNVRRGKTLTKEEKEKIEKQYLYFFRKGLTKKLCIDKTSEIVGRGYWSILKIINSCGIAGKIKDSGGFFAE